MIRDIKGLTTHEGVASLRDMAKTLQKASLDLVSSTYAMNTVFAGEVNNLGPYRATYEDMVASALMAIEAASGDIETLKNKLESTANGIENWLNGERPTGGDSGAGGPSAPVKKLTR